MRRRAPLGLVFASLVLACGGCADLFAPDEAPGFPSGRTAPKDPALAAPAGATADGTGSGAGGATNGTATSTTPPSKTPGPTARLAQKLAISEIALFQGVKVSLAKAGTKQARTVPVVAGRDAMLRVHVTPEAGYAEKSVRAELHVIAGGVPQPVASQTRVVAAASADASLASTFNFDLTGANVAAGTEYFVQLVDDTAPEVPTTAASTAQYPTAGTNETLDAVSGADALKIVVVPVAYAADGSKRLPDTSGAVIEELRKRTLELYPVPAVSITVRAAIETNTAIGPLDDAGWSAVLARVTQLRIEDKAAPDVYYYGVFAPAATLSAYCNGTCVLGLSNYVANVTDATQRASVGVLYNSTSTFQTLPHELGHAHGRKHAPCGNAAGADASFPYANATIGVLGYSIVSKQLKVPTAATTPHDFMSYCGPEWTSDYTFKALFERGRAIKAAYVKPRLANVAPRPLRFLLERPGTLAWSEGPAFESDAAFGGEERRVAFEDGGGNVIGTALAHRYDYDHFVGGYYVVPEAPPGTVRVVVDGAGVVAAP